MLQSLRRGLHVLCSRRIYLFLMVIVPVAGAFFFLSLMHDGLPTRTPVVIVDMDGSAMSRTLSRRLAASELLDVTHTVGSFNEAMRLVRAGRIIGFFYIPADYQKNVGAGRTPTVSFYSNITIFVPGTLAIKGFKSVAVGEVGGIMETKLAATGASTVLDGQLALSPLSLDTHLIGNPWTNYSYYLSVLFLPALIELLVMTVTVFSITSEIKWGRSPQWLAVSGGSMLKALAGMLLPQTVVFTAMGVVIQAVMFGFLHFPIHCPAWHMVLAMFLMVLASQSLALVYAEIVPNVRLSLILVSLTGILAFSIAGFSFPVNKMYGAVGIFSYILPVRYYFLIYIDQALNGIPLYYSRLYYAALLAFTLVPLLGVSRLRRRCLRPVYVR